MIGHEGDAIDATEWNEFVQAQPDGTFFHLAEWGTAVHRAFGHPIYYLIAKDGQQVKGVLPLGRVRSRLFGDTLISVPFGVYGGILATDDLARDELTKAAQGLASRLGVDCLELRNRARMHEGWPHKDLYVTALGAGDVERAEAHRNDAIDAYLRGFESDWRDAYPGINAVQLIARGDRTDPRLASLIAVVEYSLRRKIDRDGPDYWDHATLLELATLADDESAARAALDDALASTHEGWMTESTADTLDAVVAMGAPNWVREAATRLRRAD